MKKHFVLLGLGLLATFVTSSANAQSASGCGFLSKKDNGQHAFVVSDNCGTLLRKAPIMLDATEPNVRTDALNFSDPIYSNLIGAQQIIADHIMVPVQVGQTKQLSEVATQSDVRAMRDVIASLQERIAKLEAKTAVFTESTATQPKTTTIKPPVTPYYGRVLKNH